MLGPPEGFWPTPTSMYYHGVLMVKLQERFVITLKIVNLSSAYAAIYTLWVCNPAESYMISHRLGGAKYGNRTRLISLEG